MNWLRCYSELADSRLCCELQRVSLKITVNYLVNLPYIKIPAQVNSGAGICIMFASNINFAGTDHFHHRRITVGEEQAFLCIQCSDRVHIFLG